MVINKLEKIKNEIMACNTGDLTGDEAEKRQLWYGWLFEGTHADICIPLWESAYTGEKDVLISLDTLEVIKCYYSENAEAAKEGGQPADYIGYELEFYIYLLKSGKDKKAKEFYEKHLSLLMTGVFFAVEKFSEDEHYKKLAAEAMEIIRMLNRNQGIPVDYYELPIVSTEL